LKQELQNTRLPETCPGTKRFLTLPYAYSFMSLPLLIERYFWTFFVAGIVLGLLVPQMGMYKGLLLYIVAIGLYLAMLKVDISRITDHLKHPLLILYVLIVTMVIIPTLFFFGFSFFGAEVAAGILLIVALPAGVATPILTDISKGDVSLSLVITVFSHLVVLLTLPALFFFLAGTTIELDYAGIVTTLFLLIVIPTLLSEVSKRLFQKQVKKITPTATAIAIVLSIPGMGIAIGAEAATIWNNLPHVLSLLVPVYLAFLLLHLIGYLSGIWLPKKEKIAIANSTAFTNIGLGLVLSLFYFPSTTVLILVLAHIAWGTVLPIFTFYERFLP
jgi:predicted Na+-dependent transporter